MKEIVLAGGCFWGVEKYIANIPGIIQTEVGYANGKTENPTYEEVCNNFTGHAEVVKVQYDTEIAKLDTILNRYFEIIDPTSVNKQGGDIGQQYRTGIYYSGHEDTQCIQTAIATLQKQYDKPIAIQVLPLENYYTAKTYHQKYLDKNPGGYCHIPKAMFEKAKKEEE